MKNSGKFFDIAADPAENMGFAHFSAPHLLGILLLSAGAVLLCMLYKRSGQKRRRALRLGAAWSGAALEIGRAALLLAQGEYGIGRLPLHLCGMAVYIMLFHALCPRRLAGQFLYAFCMPGAVAAVLFPDWSYYPFWSFMSLCSFILHGLIISYVLMQTAGGDIRPEKRLLPACLGMMLLIALPVYAFDRLTGTNYMFLNWPAEQSPLEWFAFLGRPGYILGYLPLLLVVWTLLYLPGKKSAD